MKHISRFFLVLLIAIMVMVPMAAEATTTYRMVVVTTDGSGVNVRDLAHNDTGLNAREGSYVDVYAKKDGWYYTHQFDGTHLIRADYLIPANPQDVKSKGSATSSSKGRVVVRSIPSTNGNQVAVVDPGTKVEVHAVKDEWAKVTVKVADGNQYKGYIKENLLQDLKMKAPKTFKVTHRTPCYDARGRRIGYINPSAKPTIVKVGSNYVKLAYHGKTFYVKK